ncbi:carbonic anhydrase [Mycena floridula]|nr:carbonic anhydrase [Mycena floridula]
MSASPDYVAKNAAYAAAFKPGDIPSFNNPAKPRGMIVTCMDPRIAPYTQFGAKLGDNAVIRNAGGSTREGLRSLILAQQLGNRNVAVIHHTDCGMTHLTTKGIRAAVKEAHPGDAAAAKAIDEINFLEFTDIDESVRDDVKFLRDHPLILKETNITGWTFDVKTGKVHRVV